MMKAVDGWEFNNVVRVTKIIDGFTPIIDQIK